MTETLFTTFADRVMDRVDEVLSNRECKWPPSEDQRGLLGMLKARRGRERAMPIGEISERLKITPRQVKDLVQDLRLNFRVQIGASRDSNEGGYFLGNTREEMVVSSTQMLHQAVTMLRVVSVMRSEHDTEDLITQIRLALTKEVAR
jgi:DNA-binding IscR family transcriptional regulator